MPEYQSGMITKQDSQRLVGIDGMRSEGWEIENIVRLDEMAIYHLIKYTDEEKAQQEAEAEAKMATAAERDALLLSNALDIVQKKPEEAQTYLQDGYVYTGKWKGLVELTLWDDGHTVIYEDGPLRDDDVVFTAVDRIPESETPEVEQK